MATYSLTNMRTRLRDLLNEETAFFYSNADLDRWLNDGQRDVAIKTLCIQNIDSISTTSGTRYVSYNGYKCRFLEYSTDGIGLIKIIPTQYGNMLASGTAPVAWYENGTTVCLEPLPNATYSLNAYIADYATAELSGDDDLPTIKEPFLPLIVLYAHACALKKGNKIQQAMQIYSMYLSEITYLKKIYIDQNEESREHSKWPEEAIRLQ